MPAIVRRPRSPGELVGIPAVDTSGFNRQLDGVEIMPKSPRLAIPDPHRPVIEWQSRYPSPDRARSARPRKTHDDASKTAPGHQQ
jgi:hypothetical protein